MVLNDLVTQVCHREDRRIEQFLLNAYPQIPCIEEPLHIEPDKLGKQPADVRDRLLARLLKGDCVAVLDWDITMLPTLGDTKKKPEYCDVAITGSRVHVAYAMIAGHNDYDRKDLSELKALNAYIIDWYASGQHSKIMQDWDLSYTERPCPPREFERNSAVQLGNLAGLFALLLFSAVLAILMKLLLVIYRWWSSKFWARCCCCRSDDDDGSRTTACCDQVGQAATPFLF
jgi:hypothetical protein